MGTQAFSKDTASRGNLWQFDPKDLVVIGIDTKDGPEHELWDERIKLPLDEGMIVNFMAIGVKSTVTIRKNPATGKAEVADGRRRVLHGREANKRLKKLGEPLIKIPCALETGDESHMATVAIALNEIRVDDGTMVKAAKAIRLLNRNGDDHKAVAIAFGVSTQTIKNWIKLVELAAPVRKAVERGQISASAATALHAMEKDEQVEALEKLTKAAKASGKKKVGGKAAKKAAGKATTIPKRVLLKLITDEETKDKLEPEVIYGIKLAIGDHLPGENSKIGKLLTKAGYAY